MLLIGEFGNADNDPPVKVQVVDDLFSDGTILGNAGGVPVNFRGTQIQVTPLSAGPSLVLAEVNPKQQWSNDCPADIQQVVRVTWAGGVRLPNGDDLGEPQRRLYRVTIKASDGASEEIAPAALADLGDRDNNHLLCLATPAPVLSVAFPAGHLVDPNQDLNPEMQVTVNRVR